MSRLLAASAAIALLPGVAFAQALSELTGLFNIFVGLMLTGSILLFATGLVLWFIRRGTYPTYRDEGIELMEWSVAILFVLIVLLALVQFVQMQPWIASFVVGLIVLILIIWYALYVATSGMGDDEKEH